MCEVQVCQAMIQRQMLEWCQQQYRQLPKANNSAKKWEVLHAVILASIEQHAYSHSSVP